VAEFTDREALSAAMRGTSAAFALTTPFESGADAEVRQGRAIIAAAAAAGLPFLVFSSVAGATAGTGVPHFESKAVVERELAGSGLTHTTPVQMARDLSAALGRPVRYREVPVSAIGSPDMAAMWTFLRGHGYQVDIAALGRDYPHVGWTSFAAWALEAFPGNPA
jgi:subtilisin family serine protease